MKRKKKAAKEPVKYKLDIGCGKNKKEGFLGVDAIKMDGVDVVTDVRKTPWQWPDNSVSEVNCSHFLEHLDGPERVAFYNELYRVMEPGAKASIVVPHWGSGRAYGDPTHKFPPVVEMSFYYLSKEWRDANAPHCGLDCDFGVTWGHSLAQPWNLKTPEQQAFGVNHYREVAQDIVATLEKK